jgi:YesN/AraC family two-component response regulator
MPKMDGVELLEAVKKIKPEIPIVMISGHGDGNG